MTATKPATRRVASGKGHRYIVDGTSYSGRGVTTLLALPKPALINWAANVTAEAAVNERDVWLPMVEAGRDRAAIEYLKEARWQTTTEAAVRGTDVHTLAERLSGGEEVEVDERTEGFVDAYLAFRADFRPTNEITERMVVNRRHVYAGTFDLIAELRGHPDSTGDRPVRLLIDYKTGKGVYPETCLQLAAYRHAETMLPGLAGNPDEEVPVPEVDGAAVLHLRGDGTYELRPVQAGEREFRTFLYAAQIADFTTKGGWGETVIGRPIAPNPTEETRP